MSWNIGDNKNIVFKLKTKMGFYHVVLTAPRISPNKLSPVVVEMEHLPDIEKIDSKKILPKTDNL